MKSLSISPSPTCFPWNLHTTNGLGCPSGDKREDGDGDWKGENGTSRLILWVAFFIIILCLTITTCGTLQGSIPAGFHLQLASSRLDALGRRRMRGGVVVAKMMMVMILYISNWWWWGGVRCNYLFTRVGGRRISSRCCIEIGVSESVSTWDGNYDESLEI